MDRITALREQRSQTLSRLDEIQAAAVEEDGTARSLTEEESTEFDELEARATQLANDIERAERLASAAAAPQRSAPGSDISSSDDPPAGSASAEARSGGAPAVHVQPERRPYQLSNVLRHLARPDESTRRSADVELRASDAWAEHQSKSVKEGDVRGVIVPHCALANPHIHTPEDVEARGGGFVSGRLTDAQVEARAQLETGTGGGSGTGAAGVSTDHLAAEFIPGLRARSVAVAAGVRVLDGLMGDVSIPKWGANGAFTFVDEGNAPAEGTPTMSSVTMRPHTGILWYPVSRKMLRQSSPSANALVTEDFNGAFAEGIDSAIISADGLLSNPTGIINQAGVLTHVGVRTSWADVVQLETSVGNAKALKGVPSYMASFPAAGAMKTAAKDAGSGRFIMEGGDTNGYRTHVSVNVPDAATMRLLFGDFSSCVVGMWGGVDLLVDPYTKATDGGVRFIGYQDMDVALRYGQSFCKLVDA